MRTEDRLFETWTNRELLWLWGQVRHRSSRDAKRGICFLMVLTNLLAERYERRITDSRRLELFYEFLEKQYEEMPSLEPAEFNKASSE
jgi:hypothetical protein